MATSIIPKIPALTSVAGKKVQLKDLKLTIAGAVIGTLAGLGVASKYKKNKWLYGGIGLVILGIVGGVADGYLHDAALRNSTAAKTP